VMYTLLASRRHQGEDAREAGRLAHA